MRYYKLGGWRELRCFGHAHGREFMRRSQLQYVPQYVPIRVHVPIMVPIVNGPSTPSTARPVHKPFGDAWKEPCKGGLPDIARIEKGLRAARA